MTKNKIRKKETILVLLFFLGHLSTGLSQVLFRDCCAMSALQDSARITGKLLFIDMYTTWCTPCKEMDKQVFSTGEAGDLLNQYCVAVKADAEKGEGIAIAKQYGVKGYPTYLLVDGKGRLLYKHVGMASVQQLREIIRIALEERLIDKPVAVWEEELEVNSRNADFLKAYIRKKNQLGMDISGEFFLYLKLLTPAEQSDAAVAELVAESRNEYPVHGQLFQWLVSRYLSLKAGIDSISVSRLETFIETNMRKAIHQIIKEKDEEQFGRFLKFNEYADGRFLYQDNHQCKEVYYRVTRNMEQYRSQVVPYLDTLLSVENHPRNSSVANTLNNGASFLQMHTDSSLYKKALYYVEKAIAIRPDIYPLQFLPYHTYAGLLFKMGRKDEAIANEEHALKLVLPGDHFFEVIRKSLQMMKQH